MVPYSSMLWKYTSKYTLTKYAYIYIFSLKDNFFIKFDRVFLDVNVAFQVIIGWTKIGKFISFKAALLSGGLKTVWFSDTFCIFMTFIAIGRFWWLNCGILICLVCFLVYFEGIKCSGSKKSCFSNIIIHENKLPSP